VDVDQPGDYLAARINGVGRIARDVCLYSRNVATYDRHVANTVKSDRGINYASALD
jgi:hypothetical protein